MRERSKERERGGKGRTRCLREGETSSRACVCEKDEGVVVQRVPHSPLEEVASPSSDSCNMAPPAWRMMEGNACLSFSDLSSSGVRRQGRAAGWEVRGDEGERRRRGGEGAAHASLFQAPQKPLRPPLSSGQPWLTPLRPPLQLSLPPGITHPSLSSRRSQRP